MRNYKLIAKITSWILLLTWYMPMSANDYRFYVYNAANGLSDNSAQTIHCTKTGRLVITTMGQINFFDGQKFSFIDPSTENIYPLDNYRGHYHLYFDRYHHMWLKNKHSVTCVDLMTERFVDSIEDIFHDFGVSGKVTDMFVDQTNSPWLLTEKGLWNAVSKRLYNVRRDHELQDLEIYQDKYLLLFFENGQVDVLELSTGTRVYESHAYDKADEARYDKSSLVFADGNTFFQIRNGQNQGILMMFDIGRWTWKTILKTPYYLSNIVEHDSLLYVASAYGYWTYDRQTEKMEHTEKLDLAQGGQLLTDINAIAFDKQGGLWIGTEKRGLLYSRPSKAPFQVYDWNMPRATELALMMDRMPEPVTTYRDRSVNCVFRDSRGWEWVGTSTGLQLYKKRTDNLPIAITSREGLLNNVIHTIIEDDFHNIWVGTSYGISCLLIANDDLRYINSYNQWDNIPCESFVNGRSIRLDDGSIAMQMLDHVIEFNPAEMVTINRGTLDNIYPKLIRLMVNGNNIKTGQEVDGQVILEKALSRTAVINLPYNLNSVSLTFSALNYFRPQQTFYRVRINGLDDAWRVLTRYNSGGLVDGQWQLHLPLMTLRPGSYTIQVQTSMVPNKWDTEPYEWVINVNEPWWRTTGMIALFGFLFSILLVINIYYYTKNYGMRATRKSEELVVIKRIKNFAERCDHQGSLLLEPVPDEYIGASEEMQSSLSPKFMDMMERIMPVVLGKKTENLTMHELSTVAQMDIQGFYQLVIDNIYKSPRPLAKKRMLAKAEQLLITTQKSLDEIAAECDFISANYFIGTFFHVHRMLPEEYRRQKRRTT